MTGPEYTKQIIDHLEEEKRRLIDLDGPGDSPLIQRIHRLEDRVREEGYGLNQSGKKANKLIKKLMRDLQDSEGED